MSTHQLSTFDFLVDSIRRGDTQQFKTLFKLGKKDTYLSSFTGREDKRFTLLGHAAYEGQLEILKFLLSEGADLELADVKFRQTPLLLALKQINAQCVLELVNAGANPNACLLTDDGKLSANALIITLNAMCSREYQDEMSVVCEALLLKGADIHAHMSYGIACALWLVIERESEVGFELLLKHGLDLNKPINNRGETALINIINYKKSFEWFKKLVDAGADPYQTNADGKNVMHYISLRYPGESEFKQYLDSVLEKKKLEQTIVPVVAMTQTHKI